MCVLHLLCLLAFGGLQAFGFNKFKLAGSAVALQVTITCLSIA